MFKDSKGVIKSLKLKDKHHNYQTKSDKKTNNDLQNYAQKTKIKKKTNTKIGDELRFFGRVSNSCCTSGTRRNLILNNMHTEMKNKKYHTVGTVQKSNRKIVERCKINITNIHLCSRRKCNSIKESIFP
jgi:hypothetical protein